jgi:uncharacterized protein
MIKKIFTLIFIVFIGVNMLAFVHAYKFTHFSSKASIRTRDPKELSPLVKTKVLLTGIDNPKPTRTATPKLNFKTIQIKSDVLLEAWHVTTFPSKGTVILFHGYSGEKSALISRAEEFTKLGYNTLLVDFMGSGGSEGEGTTIGYTESREVKDCFDYVAATGEKNIHLFGTSMGAASVLKALDDYVLHPSSIILECPFGSLYKTVCARFKMMGVPSFPMAGMLTFWGGFQQGYWAFGHNPASYAKSVTCPALLLYGELDDRVTMEETQEIYQNMKGKKVLVTYPNIGHSIFTQENTPKWIHDVSVFMQDIPNPNVGLGQIQPNPYLLHGITVNNVLADDFVDLADGRIIR